jgi:hypothetical protein
MIEKLEKQRKRIEKAAAANFTAMVQSRRSPPRPAAIREAAHDQRIGKLITETIADQGLSPKPERKPEPAPVAAIDTSIPDFLQRKKLDPVAEQILQEQQDLKRRKSAGRIAKMKAKAKGDLKKMPLTGKAALDAIRGT